MSDLIDWMPVGVEPPTQDSLEYECRFSDTESIASPCMYSNSAWVTVWNPPWDADKAYKCECPATHWRKILVA